MESWNGRTRTCDLVDSCDCFFLLSYVPDGAWYQVRRASFGHFPRADAAQINDQAVTPGRRIKIQKKGGNERGG